MLSVMIVMVSDAAMDVVSRLSALAADQRALQIGLQNGL